MPLTVDRFGNSSVATPDEFRGRVVQIDVQGGDFSNPQIISSNNNFILINI